MTKKQTPHRRISFLLASRREIGAAEFKAHCLEIMDEVERSGTEVIVTKHRKPVVRLVPFGSKAGTFCGSLKGMVLAEKDLIAPIDVEWDADQSNLT